MDFKEIVSTRYATKKFSGEMLPQEKIDELLDLIKLAPSSFGLQQFKIKIISDQETKEKLLPASFNQPQITTASHILVFCTYDDYEDRIAKYEQMMLDAGTPKENVDSYIGMMRGFLANISKDHIPAWSARQAYIALGNALNGAKALGFDSCPMEGFDPKQYKEILNLPEGVEAVVVCPVGVAADTPRPKMRYSDQELFF